jgi:oligosaccharide repeat unit polymerase
MVLFYEALQPGLGHPEEQIAWYAVLMIIGATILTRACRVQKQFDLFEPLHLAFAVFLVFYPVRALFAVWLNESWFDPSQRAIWTGLSASALGYVCFAIGYKLTQKKSQRSSRSDRVWNFKRARTLSMAFLFLGLTGFVLLRVLGGSIFYFITLDPDIKAPGSIAPWFYYLLWLCLLIEVGALIQFGVWLSTRRQTLWTFVYCLLGLLSTFLLARYFTVLFLLMLAVCWHYKKRKIEAKQVVAFGLLLTIYLGIAGLYREWISPGYDLQQTGELVELAADQNKLVLRYVVSNLEDLSNLSDVITMAPTELPYQFGLTFTPIFLKPVPRALIPAKPLGASALFTRQVSPVPYENGFVTTLGGWGEWYLNFSWLGITLGMGLTGAMSSRAYQEMHARNSIAGVLLYSCLLVLLFSWLRSDFNAATTYALYYFIPSVVALAYVTKAKSATRQAGHR